MRQPLEKVQITQELVDYYTRVGAFLKRNPCIKHKRLPRIGYEVDVSTIPQNLVEEWIEITKQ